MQTYTAGSSPAPVFRPIIHGLTNAYISRKQLGHARRPSCVHMCFTHLNKYSSRRTRIGTGAESELEFRR